MVEKKPKDRDSAGNTNRCQVGKRPQNLMEEAWQFISQEEGTDLDRSSWNNLRCTEALFFKISVPQPLCYSVSEDVSAATSHSVSEGGTGPVTRSP